MDERGSPARTAGGAAGPGTGGARSETAPGARDTARETAQEARETARDTAEEVKERARRTAREAQETVEEKGRELGREARERAREVRDRAERHGDRWTSSLGRRTDRLVGALRAASGRLRDEEEDGMADVAEQAADQVERVGGYLEDEDPSAMLHDLEDLGRRNPATFLGTTFALGLLAGRFLRASRPESTGGRAATGEEVAR